MRIQQCHGPGHAVDARFLRDHVAGLHLSRDRVELQLLHLKISCRDGGGDGVDLELLQPVRQGAGEGQDQILPGELPHVVLLAGLDAELAAANAVAQGVLLADGSIGGLLEADHIPVRQLHLHRPADPVDIQLLQIVRLDGIGPVGRIGVLQVLVLLGDVAVIAAALPAGKQGVGHSAGQEQSGADAEHQAQTHDQDDPSGPTHRSSLHSCRYGSVNLLENSIRSFL